MSSLGCKTSCIVIKFLAVGPFVFSYSLVSFKNSPENLT